MSTDLFLELKRRLEALGDLLPPQSATAIYSRRDLDLTMSYQILAHAEIESFLEQASKVTLEAAVSAWLQDQRPRKAIVALLAFTDGDVPPQSLAQATGRSGDNLRGRIEKARIAYGNVVYRNNGVKAPDVLSLLLPVGIAAHEIGSTWLNTLDGFGSQRGDLAHRSSNQITVQLDPVGLRRTVDEILDGLDAIDRKLEALATE